ncbi:Fimbrillin-like [Prevotella sp. tc2-28]|uniref:fimbrillin family protein n=1 Tax=Prevotella sp. tc2-28 TaxID=1761888 RepID=UPI0008950BC6|nr:fimbrillin family protein [Prevotella sp. tc2-28]SEA72999.1 Fimbrillin-like [Prevotella sp. tc2-28]
MKKGISHILVIMALLFAAGCSKDAADNTESAQESQPASLKVVGLTRATSGNTDWDDIHIYLTSSGTQVAEGKFGYASDTKEWSTHLKLKSGAGTFRLYGFMPDDPSLTASLQNVTPVDAQIKLENVNPLTTKDYCVVTGVRQVETALDHTSATRGMFSFDYDSYRQNYINLFLDHLMSRLVFNMKISPTYDAVRTIKVKKMTLKLADISSMSVTVTFSDNHGISAISYIPTGAAANSCIIENEEKTLTTSPAAICTGYMVPDNVFINKLELETEFEVYNKKGDKIDERTAVNKLTEPLAELQRGEERTLLLTIDPSYLYVLSDPDLDNPTIRIN